MAMDDEKEAMVDTDQDESSESDGEEDEEERAQLQELEAAVVANPSSYEEHVQYISALRNAGLLEKLRVAREAMNAVFPLNPGMWIEWCQDEARLASGAEDVLAVEALYERGVQEYLSVPLWCDYLEFVEENDTAVAQCTVEGIAKMRSLFERALTAAGLHYAEGGKVWEAYREFEQALLISVVGKDSELNAGMVRNLFHRELKIPLANHATTLEEYKEWELQQGVQTGDKKDELAGLPTGVALGYKKAAQMCGECDAYESKIATGTPADGELFQHYLAYISLEEATGEPVRAQIMYERTVTMFPVTPDVWLKYTQYLEANLKVSSLISRVYARAVRNCPWVGTLWTKYLQALERCSAPESELAAVFEQSLLSGLQTPNEYLELFLTRAHVVRRRIMMADGDADKKVDLALLHDTFDRASQFMTTYFPDFVDRSLRLPTYWARLETQIQKDVVAARGIWENLIKTHGGMVEVWQSYIAMELSLGNVQEARSIYKRCYGRRLEGIGTELMCRVWLCFEEEYGSLEEYDRAALKVGTRLAAVQTMQHQQEVKASANPHSSTSEAKQNQGAVENKAKSKKEAAKKAAKKSTNNVQGENPRKRGLGYSEPLSAAKRRKSGSEVVTDSTAMDGQDGDKAVGNMDQAMEDAGLTPADSSVGQEEGREVAIPTGARHEPSSPSKPVVYTDECTAFLSNISFDATEEDIREFFASCGCVKDVRLLKEHSTGRPRGLAYVEFEDEESLGAAVAKNKEVFKGRSLSIARSDPKGGRVTGSARGRGSGSARGRGSSGGGRGQAAPALVSHRRGGNVKLTGNNTFAVPRSVARPLGWGNPKVSPNPSGDEAPKSNSEFRSMLLK